MRKIIRFLFLWRKMYRRFELQKRWWHRLTVVLFFVALTPIFLYSWVIGDEANGPVNYFEPDIVYLSAPPLARPHSNNVNSPDGSSQVSAGSGVDPFTIGRVNQKTIEMPNGKTATFPGIISDEAINTEWQHNLSVANTKAIFYGFGVALLIAVIFSYLLQTCYRAVLYVIYGAMAGQSVDDTPAEVKANDERTTA